MNSPNIKAAVSIRLNEERMSKKAERIYFAEDVGNLWICQDKANISAARRRK